MKIKITFWNNNYKKLQLRDINYNKSQVTTYKLQLRNTDYDKSTNNK